MLACHFEAVPIALLYPEHNGAAVDVEHFSDLCFVETGLEVEVLCLLLFLQEALYDLPLVQALFLMLLNSSKMMKFPTPVLLTTHQTFLRSLLWESVDFH